MTRQSSRRQAHVEVGITLKDLDGSVLASIIDVPVVNTRRCDETKLVLADPLPELNILVHGTRLELLLLLEIKDLQCPRLSLEGDDLSVPVHDGTVGLDRPASNIVTILELDNNNFGLGGLALLFSHADVRVGLECLA